MELVYSTTAFIIYTGKGINRTTIHSKICITAVCDLILYDSYNFQDYYILRFSKFLYKLVQNIMIIIHQWIIIPTWGIHILNSLQFLYQCDNVIFYI